MRSRGPRFFTPAAALAVGSTLWLVGCTLGPDPTRPPSIVQPGDAFHNADPDARNGTPDEPPAEVGPWWRRFDDALTNRLVDQALANNTDLRSAAAAVLEAEAMLGVAVGQQLPAFDASLSRDRRQSTFQLQADRFTSRATTYTAQASVSWQVDLFGKLRRGTQRAELDLLAGVADREALMHTIVAEVVRTRARLATLQRQLAIARQNTASFAETVEVIRRRYERGVTSALDLRLAEENLAASRAREPEIQSTLRTTQHALDVLVGRRPGSTNPLPDTLSDLPDLAPPPTGLPIHLVDRRPDLRGAEFRAMSEQAGIGVAVADMFPDISVTASGGYEGSEFADLFDGPESLIWNLTTAAAVKLWRGGALRAQAHAARARADRLAADYAGDVLNALREVEDALVRERFARTQYDRLEKRLAEARAAEDLARRRYDQGVETILTVLESERRRRNAEDALIATQQSVWNARVDLFLALGGDWGVAMPPAKEAAAPPEPVAWRKGGQPSKTERQRSDRVER